MSVLAPSLQRRLARLRLGSRRVKARAPHGSRGSRYVGSGIEFAEYRTYQSGDDARRIDPGVLARLDQRVVRERLTDRGLDVTILLDMTASMAVATKASHARGLAAGLLWIALQEGDRVQLAAFDGDGLSWAPTASDRRRSTAALRWLADVRPSGAATLSHVVRGVGPRLKRGGLLIIISDGWYDDLLPALRMTMGWDQEIVFLVVLDPMEIDPERLGLGPLRIVDAETGRVLDVDLSHDAIRRRKRFIEVWHEHLGREVAKSGGRMAVIPTHHDLERVLARDLVRAGVVT